VTGAAQAVPGTGAVHADAAGAQRAALVRRIARAAAACLDGLAGQRGRLPAVAVGGGARGQDEQPGAWLARHGNAERAVGIEPDQIPPPLREGGEGGEAARDPAVGARRGRVQPGGHEPRGKLRDLGSDRKVGVQRRFLRVSAAAGTPALDSGLRGQRQHEEKRQHSTARWLICCGDMRAMRPYSREVVKSADVTSATVTSGSRPATSASPPAPSPRRQHHLRLPARDVSISCCYP
jgi:hypothetical protein